VFYIDTIHFLVKTKETFFLHGAALVLLARLRSPFR